MPLYSVRNTEGWSQQMGSEEQVELRRERNEAALGERHSWTAKRKMGVTEETS